jgi:hypothetical protein
MAITSIALIRDIREKMEDLFDQDEWDNYDLYSQSSDRDENDENNSYSQSSDRDEDEMSEEFTDQLNEYVNEYIGERNIEERMRQYVNLQVYQLNNLPNVINVGPRSDPRRYGGINMRNYVINVGPRSDPIRYGGINMRNSNTYNNNFNLLIEASLTDYMNLQDVPPKEVTHDFKVVKLSDISLTHEDPTCAVCLDDIEDPNIDVGLLDCNHVYHHKCILTWCQKNPICPVCRADVKVQ